MNEEIPEHTLEFLLAFDGRIHHYPDGYFVKFEIKRIDPTRARPHGLRYSFTLHGPEGTRLVGFDNAHAVSDVKGPGGKGKKRYDHKHRLRTIRPYEYSDAATLLGDFWAEVDAVLREKGVLK